MALTQGTKVDRRGPPAAGEFGYYVAPGEQIWRGSLCGLNAAGQLIRWQTATVVVFAGIAMQDYSNVGNAAASPVAVPVARGLWQIAVPAVTFANLNANVYASDDSTLTLTLGTGIEAIPVGTVNGFENGSLALPYIRLAGT